MFLEMADDGLNGGTPFELALDLRRDAALLAGRVDLELVIGWGVVAAIAGIGDAAIEDVADQRLHLRNELCPCRCTRPLARAGNRPCDRAGGAPVPARAGPGTAAVRMLPADLHSRRCAVRCRG